MKEDKKKLNILFVCPTLSNGGAERVCVSWANGLSARGHNVDILIKPGAGITYQPDERVKVINLPRFACSLLNRIPLLSDTLRLRKLLKKGKYDVVVEVLFYLYFPIRLATWMIKPAIPAVFTSHDAMERPSNIRHPFKFILIKFFANRFYNHITVLTHRDWQILKSKGFSHVSVLHNPLFLKSKKIDPSEKKNLVLSVGRIDAWFYKGFDILIKAWNILYPDFPDWKLQIVGNSSDTSLKYLKSLILDKDSVEFVPFTNSIEDNYKEASIYCLSSRYEGWGLVIPEAMSRGCAVVACDFKGRQAEIINDGINGLLCEPQNVNELVLKLKTLMSNDELRRAIQTSAPMSLDNFKEEVVSQKLESILTKVCRT
ncbi:MAG: glycosyltransferase [Muribaculaceae bacterium]|nr:glycosyltransferase [Muribaculaceae bacterium]